MTEVGPPVWLLGDTSPDAVAIPGPWSRLEGFDLPDDPWDLTSRRWICVGRVADLASARAALAALARGVGLAVALSLEGRSHQRFLEDLHKIGRPVRYESAAPRPPEIGPTHEALLDALAAGATVTAAAEQIHVSRRTANRLLTDARTVLGVETTAEAITRWSAGPHLR